MRLAGKIALVTGAASGFGEGIAKKFVAEGARVVVVDRDGEGALRAAARLGAAALGVRADVTIGADVKAMVEAVHERFGGLDILVNNAGMGHLPQPLEDLPEDEFDRILAVNVKAIYRAAKEVVPRFKAQRHGVILNIASTAGVSPRPRLAWYNASKGWVITATRAMAVELAPFGIRVNAVAPGYFKTGPDGRPRGRQRLRRVAAPAHAGRPLGRERRARRRRRLPRVRRGELHLRPHPLRRRRLHRRDVEREGLQALRPSPSFSTDGSRQG